MSGPHPSTINDDHDAYRVAFPCGHTRVYHVDFYDALYAHLPSHVNHSHRADSRGVYAVDVHDAYDAHDSERSRGDDGGDIFDGAYVYVYDGIGRGDAYHDAGVNDDCGVCRYLKLHRLKHHR